MMKNRQQKIKFFGSVALLVSLAGCSLLNDSSEKDDGLAATVLSEPLSLPQKQKQQQQQMTQKTQGRCGNEPSYTLKGKTYQVMNSAKGYQQEGIASWYGAEYQGSETAGCERFDMHAFTAAHRTLPLPSFVRVSNLKNGKSVIVKVNDRGPFENKGLIQLSFAAANTLGMTQDSRVAKVRVEALDTRQQGKVALSKQVAATGRPAAVKVKQSRNKPSRVQSAAIKKAKQKGKSFFVVVKNYQSQAEALEMFVRLTSVGLNKTEMASAVSKGRKLHQVRIGPLYTQDQIDNVRDALENNGLATFKVVAVDQ